MSWDARWMDLCKFVSQWSKDRSTKCGAVIVDARNCVVSLGWNGFPRGVEDDIEERHDRPEKYLWTEHAERNAIYNAASCGHRLLGCTMYGTGSPCAACTRAIIQSGIATMIYGDNPTFLQKNKTDEAKADDYASAMMLEESNVAVYYYSPGGFRIPLNSEAHVREGHYD